MKTIAWLLVSILLLLVLVIILIQLPSVQNFAKDKAVAYLQKKIGTKVRINRLNITFPKRIVLTGVYLEDQRKDTLLIGDTLRIDIALLKLLKKEINVSYIELNNIKANIYRNNPDTVFNYEYIVKAFAGTDTTTTKSTDTSGGFKFTLGKILLKKVLARYSDDVAGNTFTCYLGNVRTSITQFDPTHGRYTIPALHLDDVSAGVRFFKPTVILKQALNAVVDTVATKPSEIGLKLDTIGMQRFTLAYKDELSATDMALNVGHFRTLPEKIDIANTAFKIKQLELAATKFTMDAGKAPAAATPKKEVPKETVAKPLPWRVDIAKLSLTNDTVSYNDNTQKPLKTGMDYSHLYLSQIAIDADAVVAASDQYRANIKQVSFDEKSGFKLSQLSTDAVYTDTAMSLKNLLVRTNHSVIRSQAYARYTSVTQLSKQPGNTFVDLDLVHDSIAVRDVIMIMPAMQAQLKKYERNVLHVNGKAKGYVKNISIPNFEASGIGNTALQLNGNIQGLPDGAKAYYNINLKKLVTSRRDIQNFAPPKTMPDSIRIPENISMTGNFKGTQNDFTALLDARTTNGNLLVSGSMKNKTSYDVKATVDKVDVGYITMQEKNIGKVSLEATAKGNGFDYKKMTTDLHAKVINAEVKGYEYKNLLLDATANNGEATVKSSINDPNIHYTLDAASNLTNKYPSVKMQLQLDTLNLQALHFVTDTLQFHGNINADFASTNPDSLQGVLVMKDVIMLQDSMRYNTDSISLVAERNANIQALSLHTEFADVKMEGEYKLTETGTALQQVIKKYYAVRTFKDTAFTAQNWQLDLKIRTSPLLLQFQPGLKGTDTITGKINFNSNEGAINANIVAPKVRYAGQTFTGVHVYANTEADRLQYGATIDKGGSRSLLLYKSGVTGYVANNILHTNIYLKDKADKYKYRLGGSLSQTEKGIRFAFSQDTLLLNYEQWSMANDNYVEYDSTGIIVNNLALSKQEELLKINSESLSTAAPIEVNFSKFRIKTLIAFVNEDSLQVDGIIDGKAVVKNVMKDPQFTSDIHIHDLVYNKDTLGTIMVKVDNETVNAFAANLSIKGNNNDVVATGKYYTGEGRMDMKMDINQLNLAIVKAFAQEQLTDVGGFMKGNIAATGTLDKPVLRGELSFDNAYIVPVMTGEKLRFAKDKISLDEEGINFSKFTLIDSAGNKATLDGNIYTTDYKKYRFDMSLAANNFRVVNAPQASGRLFYGRLNIDANVDVLGTIDAPKIEGGFRVNKETNFTLILPSSDPEVEDRKGVVRFVDKNPRRADSTRLRTFLDSLNRTAEVRGMDVSLNIETDTAAMFTMIIDERNGDALTFRGKADLNGGMDPSGKISLTGNYILNSGAYSLSLSVLKKKFDIVKGSSITWTGDPTSAQVDITATYLAKTPSIDLMASSLSKSSDNTNKYKEKLPFLVNLKMQGELLKPVITFDITLPQSELSQWPDVGTKLQQVRNDQSELNKQVFALLLLNRFVQEDITQSGADAPSAGDMARQSASNILADQLNRFAGSLIQGVDVNFGVNSETDYSTGNAQERTDLTVGVSKKLLNDRLRVNVGSNFQLDGPSASETNKTTNIAGDVQIDYQLSKDGRYMVRAYRKDQYESVIEGQVVETGLSFILTFDYNEFKELFQRVKKEEKKERKQREKALDNKTATDVNQENKSNSTPTPGKP